jgi:hypothetical protein
MMDGLPQWPGETVAVLGGGPSLVPEQVESLRGRCRAIAINRAFEIAPWADLLFGHDHQFWASYPAAFSFAGAKAMCQPPGLSGVVRIPRVPHDDAVCHGEVHKSTDSIYTTTQVAIVQGAARVLLLGADARTSRWPSIACWRSFSPGSASRS